MFLLYLLGCWTSIQSNFLAVLVDFVFKFVVVFLLVVQRGTVHVYLCLHLGWNKDDYFLLRR